ncbi:formate dehydrogenase, partial [Klebsiella pneumoniae]
MSKSKMIVRTTFIDRACHWTVVICFFLVALSGISFFFPTLQWLTETFGTPQMGRILHPFFGVLIFVALMFMFVRFVHHNIPDKQDIPWLKGIVEVLKGNEHKVARVGKYNAGQKMMFWTIMSMIFVLLV